MRYDEWLKQVPAEMTGDSLWRLDVYRIALFCADIAWQDAVKLDQRPLTRHLADQLYRAVCSISANIAEGYSRSTGKDKARFLEYALGSAREARDWYFKARHTFSDDVLHHRMSLLTEIIKMLTVLTPYQRHHGIREAPSPYDVEPSSSNVALDIPF